MESRDNKLTYEELLQKNKDQESEIFRLRTNEISNSNLEFYFKESYDLVCKVGMDGFYKEINPAFASTLGYSKNEILSKSFSNFIHPDDIEISRNELDTLLKGINTISFENRLIKKNNEIVYIQWTISIDKSQGFIYAIGRNITVLKNTQTELLESNIQLENAQKISKIGSWEYHFDSHKMIWSNELYSIYELDKKDNQDLFKEYTSRFSKSDVEIFLNKIKESKINKKAFSVEQCAIISKEKSKWVHAIVQPIMNKNGEVISLRGTTQDINDKKQISEILKLKKQKEVAQKLKKVEEESDAKFKFYIENSPDGVIVIDDNGKYIDANKAAIIMTSYSKEELLTMSFYDLLISASNQDLEKSFEILKTKGSFIGEYKSRIKTGEIKWRYISAVKLSETRFIGFIKDITESKNNALIIENNEKRFRALVENNNEIITIIDKNLNRVFRNSSAIRITGYSHEERQEVSNLDYVHPDFITYLHEKYNESISKPNITVPVLFQVKHKKGHYIWLEGVLVNKFEDQSIKGIIGNFRDITQSKKSQILLTNTFERITDAFIALDNDWCFTYMNKKTGEIFNCDPLEMIGKNIWTFYEGNDTSFYNAYHNAKKEQKYIYLEEYFEPLNMWFESHIYPSEDGISVFFRDITKEKNAKNIIENNEKRFRALVENNEGIIKIFDENLNILFRSPSSKKVTGYSNQETLTISKSEYYHPDYLEYIYKIIQETIKYPGKIFPALLKVKHKKGHYIWLEGVLNNRLHDTNVNGIIANFRDVTNRIEANTTLVKERDIFAKIAETSPGLIYSMAENQDGSFCFPYASDAIKEIFGFDYEDIKNNATVVFDNIHPEDHPEIVKKIINTKTGLVPLKGEYRYFHPIKGIVWHEVNSLPVKEPDGTVVCHGIITDITERHEANQKILKANRLYIVISQINQMIVRTTDEESLFREACNIAVDLGEFKMAWIGLIDPNSENIIPTMIAGSCQKYFDLIRTITTNENMPEGNGPVGRSIRSGSYYICNQIENDLMMKPWKEEALNCGFQSIMSLPIKKFGKTIGAFSLYAGEKNFFDAQEIALLEEATKDVGFALELFEKEKLREKAELEVFESEQRYHTLTEVSPVGIFRTDETGYTTFVNPSWSQISGLSFDQAIGNGWLDAVHDEDKIKLFKGWEKATAVGEKSTSEYRFIRSDGTIAWVMGQAIPETNNQNEIIGYIGTVTDITDRKILEANLTIAKETAETANKSKSNFLANMSHEIRTPLNGIIGFTNLLMKTKLDANQHDYMSTINVSAALLLNIVNDVLDFSKIESGKLELFIEKLDLFKLSNQIIDLFKYQAKDKNLELILDIDQNVPQFVQVDSMKLKQILVNLLSNALKFTKVGEIRLEIKEQQISKKNVSFLKFSVKDTGKGIKQINYEKIFSSFEQEDNSTNRKFGGTGLGLAISNQLLDLMNSKLELDSVYGEGSNFSFLIKVKKAKINIDDESQLISLINTIENSTIENSDTKKILIAEDNKINMLLVKTLVKKILPNCSILTAYDGNEAIAIFSKEHPDLVLMDIQMPIKNGYEASYEIRNLFPEIKTPIIAVTAGILTGEKDKCFEAGMDDYLPKPIVFSDLENIIYKWINK